MANDISMYSHYFTSWIPLIHLYFMHSSTDRISFGSYLSLPVLMTTTEKFIWSWIKLFTNGSRNPHFFAPAMKSRNNWRKYCCLMKPQCKFFYYKIGHHSHLYGGRAVSRKCHLTYLNCTPGFAKKTIHIFLRAISWKRERKITILKRALALFSDNSRQHSIRWPLTSLRVDKLIALLQVWT